MHWQLRGLRISCDTPAAKKMRASQNFFMPGFQRLAVSAMCRAKGVSKAPVPGSPPETWEYQSTTFWNGVLSEPPFLAAPCLPTLKTSRSEARLSKQVTHQPLLESHHESHFPDCRPHCHLCRCRRLRQRPVQWR